MTAAVCQKGCSTGDVAEESLDSGSDNASSNDQPGEGVLPETAKYSHHAIDDLICRTRGAVLCVDGKDAEAGPEVEEEDATSVAEPPKKKARTTTTTIYSA